MFFRCVYHHIVVENNQKKDSNSKHVREDGQVVILNHPAKRGTQGLLIFEMKYYTSRVSTCLCELVTIRNAIGLIKLSFTAMQSCTAMQRFFNNGQ